MKRVLLCILLAGCAHAYKIGTVDVEPTGGAGFAGIRTAVLLQEPALSVPTNCVGHCSARVISDSVDLVANRHYEWRPALSTGVAFQHYDSAGFGGGVGLNIVLVPGASGQPAPWPAVTLHLGRRGIGFFAGFVIAPTDAINMPPGVTSLRVQRDAIPDLSTHNTGRAGNLWFGLSMGLGKPDTTKK